MSKRIYNQPGLFGELYAYLVILSPPDAIKVAIADMKRQLDALSPIGDRNLHSIAHITLTEKLTDDPDLAATVSNAIQGVAAFTLRAEGIGIFDHGIHKTLYIRVAPKEPLKALAKAVRKPSLTPHITLVKKLPNERFEALLPHLGNLHFEAEWTCTEVTVLRKLMREKEKGWREKFVLPIQP